MSLVSGYSQAFGGPSPPDPSLYAAAAYYPPADGGAYFQAWAFSPTDVSEYSPPGPYGVGSSNGSEFLGPGVAMPGDAEKLVPCSTFPTPTRGVRVVKRRVTADRKERRRTLSINTAFAELRDCIPNVPSDTKLSKIKTLRLATSYIAYLMDLLDRDDPTDLADGGGGFKAELGRKIDSAREQDRRKKEMATFLQGNGMQAPASTGDCKKSKGRTGWPQHVWALELKQ